MIRILFVCIENSNRSQMAEAFARLAATEGVEAASAGSRPAAAINPKAVAAMAELGYDLTTHHPKALAEVGPGPWDYVITMGCGDECPWLSARERRDWQLADPRAMADADYRQVRDEIGRRVRQLLLELDPSR